AFACAQTRADSAAVQVQGARATLPGTVQRRRQLLPSATTSALGKRLPAGPPGAIPSLARGDPGRRAPVKLGQSTAPRLQWLARTSMDGAQVDNSAEAAQDGHRVCRLHSGQQRLD